ncbi:HD domain-containing protein [Spirosoma fluminis]
MNVAEAEQFALSTLAAGLSPTLFYHGLHHVLDVVEAASRIAQAEQITDAESLDLLRTAALFHDIGFIATYNGHEEWGCQYVRDVLPRFNYTPAQIDVICGMIMATRVPQFPQTKLEQVLCDADLDYLGRDDFTPIARSLYDELFARGVIADEATWNQTQIKFLEGHSYWTASSIASRQPGKEQHLRALQALVTS